MDFLRHAERSESGLSAEGGRDGRTQSKHIASGKNMSSRDVLRFRPSSGRRRRPESGFTQHDVFDAFSAFGSS